MRPSTRQSARVTALEAQRLAETPWVRERVVAALQTPARRLSATAAGGRRPALARPHEPRRGVGRASSIASASTAIAARFATNARRWPSCRRVAPRSTTHARRRRKARQALDQAVSAHNRRLDDLDRAARPRGPLHRRAAEARRPSCRRPWRPPSGDDGGAPARAVSRIAGVAGRPARSCPASDAAGRPVRHGDRPKRYRDRRRRAARRSGPCTPAP